VCAVVNHVHLLEPSEHSAELRRFVKKDMEPVIRDHAAVHGNSEWDAMHPAAQPAVSRHEQERDRRHHPKWKTDEQFLGILGDLEVALPMMVVNAVMLPLAMGVKRLLAVAHFIMPPAMSKIVGQRPGTPTRCHIRADEK
jgi:hypothetical protein